MNQAQPSRDARWQPVRFLIIALLTVLVATLAVASAIHFGVTMAGVADRLSGAALPEAVIAIVLLFGALSATFCVRHAWGSTLGTTVFGIAGFVIGMRFTLFGDRFVAGDVAYHIGGLVLLVVVVALLASPSGRVALNSDR
jgi:nucleoside recognition membrane protein YjiH